ncbi:membrane protein [Microtetraspora sp. NBRC 13810]|uniref:DUF1206 domain-containing protein n=1 Tax=Microtetraspora sp. NBRC 13810 TaxID=3030990 RepID=UPI0024A1D027|nr:DUF1206 domain-containing protein [Microtetraspora sp. NBRC 13810]GLW09483.1 membrane protein [Microtetraspora sp. NBRC 13810]
MSSVGSTGRQARAAVRRTAGNPMMDRLTRIGLACRGVLYALIGVLALQVAFGNGGGQEADKGGAIATVATLPFGSVLLWVMVAGFAALTLWQVSEALVGHAKATDRAESAGRAAVYVLIVVSLLSMVLAGKTTSDDEKSQDFTRTLLDLPFGPFVVGLIGVGLVALGLYWGYRGVRKKFREELDESRMSARTRTLMERLGVVGYVVRGAIAALAGVFVVQAAITHDPDKAGGIDDTLRGFADSPAGPWLLALVAVGLLLFAAYCFGESRWRRT